MTSADTRVNDLVVNVMTEEQFEKITPQDNQLYLTPDEDQEWKKPADWIDIRSGALPNSVYFLVGHSADYSTYPVFAVNATISNSGTYDVFVDGIKYFTTASGSTTTLNWSELALVSGWDVTYPSSLKTHVVRVMPSDSTNAITSVRDITSTTSPAVSGLLWCHFTLTNEIALPSAFYESGVLEAVTTTTGILYVTNISNLIGNALAVKTLPILDSQNTAISASGFIHPLANAIGNPKLRKLKFRNFLTTTQTWDMINYLNNNSSKLVEITGEKTTLRVSERMFCGCTALRKIGCNLKYDATNKPIRIFEKDTKLSDFIVEATYDGTSRLGLGGTSSNALGGIKGVTVSPEAPFDDVTSPQLDVSYTGLSRAALVNLFNSMPYNVGYTVVGSPTIVDGILSNSNGKNYIYTTSQLKLLDTFSFNIRFKRTLNEEVFRFFKFGSNDCTCRISTDGRIQLEYPSSAYTILGNVSVDVWYDLELSSNSEVITSTLTNISTQEKTVNSVNVSTSGNLLRTMILGRDWKDDAYTNAGIIDLNNTYIKVNGVPWFRGTAAMTKTCSVVGCTGTADLTQEDKNIALDKGWELTVA